MSKYTELFNYLRQCPQLDNLWSIGATEDIGVKVIIPQGASQVVQYIDEIDVIDNYKCEIVPYPSIYEDYQINCFSWYDPNDSNPPQWNQNVLTLDEIQDICDWIAEQNRIGNLPQITGERVVSIECNPYVPRVRYINEQENTIGYYITIRVRYVNKTQRKVVEYGS